MRTLLKNAAAAAAVIAASGFASSAGAAGVAVGIGVGVPAPTYYYGPGYYPPGPCVAYDYYYEGDCGYPVYNGDVAFDGVTVSGPHYYRWDGDHPSFWYRGGWHQWNGWQGSHWNWEHRGWHQ